MSGHTPGPWKVFDKERTQAVMDSEGRSIIDWPGFDSSGIRDASERRANLHLIAAAPDLLEVLTWLLDNSEPYMSAIEMDHGKDGEAWAERAAAIVAAIKEATK